MKQTKGHFRNSEEVPCMDREIKKACHNSEHGLFSCVTCGILCFACVFIVQPTEAAARYIMSGDCSIFNFWEESDNEHNDIRDAKAPNAKLSSSSALMLRKTHSGRVFGAPLSVEKENSVGVVSEKAQKAPSLLGLLALTNADLSDSEEEDENEAAADISFQGGGNCKIDSPENDTDLRISDSNTKSYDRAELKKKIKPANNQTKMGKHEPNPNHMILNFISLHNQTS
ncbi:PREDICTED: lysine-specific demethylase REF6-like [Erythranthe guttata]|uniref:lysine-specific demethylase REF6-like n=1 Tax=Erythranthe guttata TaxID=4155 RepID=UPI00064DA278|nr:PREDICTED: lysine-specific demethylase REF6-like [Erythranthe guttata]|eukprot:XP_012856937.1 PREDICTED: lysine-specific demethylase REF6-like [Erythranthe guttata]